MGGWLALSAIASHPERSVTFGWPRWTALGSEERNTLALIRTRAIGAGFKKGRDLAPRSAPLSAETAKPEAKQLTISEPADDLVLGNLKTLGHLSWRHDLI